MVAAGFPVDIVAVQLAEEARQAAAVRWPGMVAQEGFVASTIKGSPYISHARAIGHNVALCGKKPGKGSNGGAMKNRAGWRYYTDGRAPTCAGCIAKINAMKGAT